MKQKREKKVMSDSTRYKKKSCAWSVLHYLSFFTLFFSAIFFSALFFTHGCYVNANCKEPELGETENIADASVRGDLVAILSSPRDVLKWCSAFITVFKYDSEGRQLIPSRVFGLSGGIARFVEWVEDDKENLFLTVPLHDKGNLDIVLFPAGKKLSVDTGIFDIGEMGAGDNSLFVLSLLQRDLIFIYDFYLFMESRGREGSSTFKSIPREMKKFVSLEINGQKKIITPVSGKNEIFVFPDRTSLKLEFPLSIVSGGENEQKTSGDNVSIVKLGLNSSGELPVTINWSSTDENGEGNTEKPSVVLSEFISYSSGFVFIPAHIEFSEGGEGQNTRKRVSGILALRKECLLQPDEEEKGCFWFLIPPEETPSDKISFFLSKGKLIDDSSEGDMIFAFVEKKTEGKDEKAYIYLWFFSSRNNFFGFIDKREILLSPFYEFVEFDVNLDFPESSAEQVDIVVEEGRKNVAGGDTEISRDSADEVGTQFVERAVIDDDADSASLQKNSLGEKSVDIRSIKFSIILLIKLNIGDEEKLSFISYEN